MTPFFFFSLERLRKNRVFSCFFVYLEMLRKSSEGGREPTKKSSKNGQKTSIFDVFYRFLIKKWPFLTVFSTFFQKTVKKWSIFGIFSQVFPHGEFRNFPCAREIFATFSKNRQKSLIFVFFRFFVNFSKFCRSRVVTKWQKTLTRVYARIIHDRNVWVT
jgi:hypothetical protein